MPKESYNLILNSYVSTNRIGTNKRNYQYMVNWNSILPKPYEINQKFELRFSFITPAVSTIGEVFNLYVDFGGSNVYDQVNSKSNYLGFCLPYSNQTSSASGTNVAYFYTKAFLNENLPIVVEYPQNNIITVSLVNLNGNYPNIYFTNDYLLNLQFTPID